MGKIGKFLGKFVGSMVSSIGEVFGLGMEPDTIVTPYNQELLSNTTGPTSYIGVVYGVRRKAGVRIATFVMGPEKQYLYAIYALSHGRVNLITNPRIDDVPVSDPKLATSVQWRASTGMDGSYAYDNPLVQELGTLWDTVNGKLEGVAFGILKVTLTPNGPKSLGDVTWDVTGKVVFDPRLGLSVYSDNPALCALDYQTNPIYGKGMPYPQAFNVASYIDAANYFDEVVDEVVSPTTYWAIYDEQAKDHGYLKVDKALFDLVTTGTTYNIAGFPDPSEDFTGKVIAKEFIQEPTDDQGNEVDPELQRGQWFRDSQYQISILGLYEGYNRATSGSKIYLSFSVTTKRYSCNGNVDTSQTVYENLKALGTSFNGYVTFFNGLSTLIPDRPEPIAAHFDSSNIVSEISVALPDKKSQLNEITGTWFDPEFGYKQMTKTVRSQVYLDRDNGQIQGKSINMPFCNNPQLLDRILTIELNKSRHNGAVQLEVMWEGLNLVAGQVITISDEDLGWTSRPYKVVRIGIPNQFNDVKLTCIPFDNDDYIEGAINPRSSRDYVNFISQKVQPPTAIVVSRDYTSSNLAVNVSWTPYSQLYTNFDLEIWSVSRAENGTILGYTSTAKHLKISGTSFTLTSDLVDGTEYELRLYVWGLTGQRSDTYKSTSYTYSDIPSPMGITAEVRNPWTVSAVPVYTGPSAGQAKVAHRWFLGEVVVSVDEFEVETTTIPSYADSVEIFTGSYLIWSGLKPSTEYRLWCMAVTNYGESDVFPVDGGVQFTTPEATAEYLGDFLGAATLRLTSTSQIFKQDDLEVVTPDDITFTAIQSNIPEGDALVWSTVPAVALPVVDGVATLTKEAFADNEVVTVTVTAGPLTDTITIVKLSDGISGLTGLLSNESHVISANSDGVITGNISLAGGTFNVFFGTENVTNQCTFSVGSSTGLTASIGALTGTYTISSMSSDEATATFTATFEGVVISKTYSITKSKEGEQGHPVITEYSVDGSTGWTGTYSTTHFYFRQSNDNGVSWSTPAIFRGEDGTDGVHTEFWFQRSSGTPSNNPTTAPLSWFDTPEGTSGTERLYVAVGNFDENNNLVGSWGISPFEGEQGDSGYPVITEYSVDGSTGWTGIYSTTHFYFRQSNDNGVSWSVPALFRGEDGEDGTDGTHTEFWFQRSSGTPINNPTTAPLSWFDTPDGTSGIQRLYVAVGNFDENNNLVGSWGIAPFEGEQGEGVQGQRGAGHFYITTSQTSWNSSVDTAATAATEGDTQIGDRVTASNIGGSFVQTRSWSGSSWLLASTVVDGTWVLNGQAIIDNLAANYIQANKIDVDNVFAQNIGATGNITLSGAGNIKAQNGTSFAQINANGFSAVAGGKTVFSVDSQSNTGYVDGNYLRTASIGYSALTQDAIESLRSNLGGTSPASGGARSGQLTYSGSTTSTTLQALPHAVGNPTTIEISGNGGSETSYPNQSPTATVRVIRNGNQVVDSRLVTGTYGSAGGGSGGTVYYSNWSANFTVTEDPTSTSNTYTLEVVTGSNWFNGSAEVSISVSETASGGGSTYTHPTDGSAVTSYDTVGAAIIDKVTVNASGHVTELGTRDLTLTDLQSSQTSNYRFVTDAEKDLWNTSASGGVALGETSSTAYRGDRGKLAYDHSNVPHAPSNANYYVHPTSAGNKHIPSGGSSGQFLKYSASGTVVWASDNNTTYSVGDGGLTQKNFTTTLKSKLDGIAASANNYSLPFTNNSANWNTAYGWGNHANAGYLTSYIDTNTWRGIDNTPVNGQTAESISSNWAYDHAASSTAHPRDTRSQIAGNYVLSGGAASFSSVTTGTINVTSARELKNLDHREELSKSLAHVVAIGSKGVFVGSYKTDSKNKLNNFFIAEEVAEVDPISATFEFDKPTGVKTNDLLAKAYSAIAALNEKVEKQDKLIKILASKLGVTL